MMMHWNPGWPPMFFFPVVMLLVFAVVVSLAVVAVRRGGGRWPPMCGTGRAIGQDQSGSTAVSISEDPQVVLRRRYARGEITRTQFEELHSESLIDLLKERVARGELTLQQFEAEVDGILADPLRRRSGSDSTATQAFGDDRA